MGLKTRLSLTFALIVLLTVLLITLLANIFINSEFKKYIQNQQEQKTQEIVTGISEQYNGMAWDLNFVHVIGMNALYDGYIVKVYDAKNRLVWDAEGCDMAGCMRVMNDVSERMKVKYPNINGEFLDKDFPLLSNGKTIGTAYISYYGPFFLSENDFHFLDTLNTVMLFIGVTALIFSVTAGIFIAKRISAPITSAAGAARQMADGDYAARLGISDKTKELTDLADSLNLLAQSLSYQESLRKHLTADVAHELRTPITSVQTHLEAMIEGMWETSTERLVSCHEEVERIGTLVKDLENLARAENEIALEKKLVTLTQIIEKAIDSFTADIQNKGLSVTVNGCAPDVPADEDRIRQVVTNLLSNAIKYTPPGGHVSICLSQTSKHAVFTITDDGVGIPAAELPFIFERFYRADKSRNRKTGGSGIGLAIVKAIVEAHGGKVEAESGVGNGSTFRVMLPFSLAKAPAASLKKGAVSRGRP